MRPWSKVLGEIKRELERCAQRLGDYPVLPDRIEARLPDARFARWAPVLPEIAAEVGHALEEWARKRRAVWHGGLGPSIELRLEEVSEVIVETTVT